MCLRVPVCVCVCVCMWCMCPCVSACVRAWPLKGSVGILAARYAAAKQATLSVTARAAAAVSEVKLQPQGDPTPRVLMGEGLCRRAGREMTLRRVTASGALPERGVESDDAGRFSKAPGGRRRREPTGA